MNLPLAQRYPNEWRADQKARFAEEFLARGFHGVPVLLPLFSHWLFDAVTPFGVLRVGCCGAGIVNGRPIA